jgi:uncharacterized membrane protein YbhN (UPF0104 family)
LANRPTRDLDGDRIPSLGHGLRDRHWLKLLIAAAVLLLVGFLLYRGIGRYEADEIIASFLEIPTGRFFTAAAFAVASYACLTGFDFLATRYVGRPVPYWYVAITSFSSLSLGHNIGFAALSSGAIRYRLYSRYGLSAGDIAKIIAFCGVTVGLGLTVLGGLALCLQPGLAADMTGTSRSVTTTAGLISLAAAAAYVAACAGIRGSFSIFNITFRLPPLRLAACQILIGPLNFALVAGCLHQALLGVGDAPYLSTATIYVLANVATLVSHVPGGLGIIEGVVLYFIPGTSVIAAVILFRLVYFLAPLVIGGLVLAISELVIRPAGNGRQRQS